MEEQRDPEMVTLVLRDIVNLALQGEYLLGDGSSDWDTLLKRCPVNGMSSRGMAKRSNDS
ncbi:MAG: hypothetical protein HGA38_00435 [Candidatus Moranbacteria bacterium]|nr:hypothetical protein [Candidatus Moranbacteria bacterium]